MNDTKPTHKCPQCGTEYFAPQPCDWCPVQALPLPLPKEPAMRCICVKRLPECTTAFTCGRYIASDGVVQGTTEPPDMPVQPAWRASDLALVAAAVLVIAGLSFYIIGAFS